LKDARYEKPEVDLSTPLFVSGFPTKIPNASLLLVFGTTCLVGTGWRFSRSRWGKWPPGMERN